MSELDYPLSKIPLEHGKSYSNIRKTKYFKTHTFNTYSKVFIKRGPHSWRIYMIYALFYCLCTGYTRMNLGIHMYTHHLS